MSAAPPGRRTASVVWELSEDEGMVVVDVDAPLRPFGGPTTPAHGARAHDVDTLPDEDALDEPTATPTPAATPNVPKPSRLFVDDVIDGAAFRLHAGALEDEPAPRDGRRRTLPPIVRSQD